MQRVSSIKKRLFRLFSRRDESAELVETVIERLDTRNTELDRQIAILRATTRSQTFHPPIPPQTPGA